MGDYIAIGTDSFSKGAIYLYQHNQDSDNWNLIKKINASDAEDNDSFGRSIQLIDDYLVVGAPYKGMLLEGAVYLFHRNQGGSNNWGEVKKFTLNDAAMEDKFGYSVALSGEYLAIGAMDKNGPIANQQGIVYIYQCNQGGANNWGEIKKLTASDAAFADNFGYSLALSGDSLVIGARDKDDDQGAAYLYQCNQGGANNWGEVKKFTASDANSDDSFGHSVAIFEDKIVIGAAYKDGPDGEGQGVVYMYQQNQGGANNWGEVKNFTASDAADDDLFGYSVALIENCIVVGASHKEGTAGLEQGAAYIFQYNQGGTNELYNWIEAKKILASDAKANDEFGNSLALSEDYLVVGAPRKDGSGEDQGAVYIYNMK